MKVVAIIPAREGSLRLPKKNRKKLLGLPLIYWSINFAKKLKFIDDIIVSTNDKVIIKKIKKAKKKIKTFIRPQSLSGKNTKTIDVIFHVLKNYEKKFDKISSILLLQPTSPIRSIKKINEGYKKFKFYKEKKSVISVSETSFPKKRNFEIKNKKLFLLKYKKNIKKKYQVNGNFYFASSIFLKKYKSFYSKNKTFPVVLNSNKTSTDIDTIYDFRKAENYLSYK